MFHGTIRKRAPAPVWLVQQARLTRGAEEGSGAGPGAFSTVAWATLEDRLEIEGDECWRASGTDATAEADAVGGGEDASDEHGSLLFASSSLSSAIRARSFAPPSGARTVDCKCSRTPMARYKACRCSAWDILRLQLHHLKFLDPLEFFS